VDRVLQHLNDPAQAVREMARVVRPGGRIAAIEPDWQTVTVAGVDNDVTRSVVRYKVDINVTHGTIGRELRRLLVEAGCIDVTAEQGSITFGQLAATDFVLGLRRSLAGAVAERWITARQAAAWWAGLEEQDMAASSLPPCPGSSLARRCANGRSEVSRRRRRRPRAQT